MIIKNTFKWVAIAILLLAVVSGMAMALTGPHPTETTNEIVQAPEFQELAVIPEIFDIEGDVITIDYEQQIIVECADCDLAISPLGDSVIIRGVLFPIVTLAPTATIEPTDVPPTTVPTTPPTVTPEPTEAPPTVTSTAVPTVTPTETDVPTISPTEQPATGGYFPVFANRPTTIYTVGDSITRCETQASCYRYHLFNWMDEDGLNIDMLGSNRSRNRAVRYYSTVTGTWDYDHGGFAGWQPDFYYQTMIDRGWADEFPADVVLLHLGINGHLPNHTSDLLSNDGDFLGIIQEFRRVNPEVVVYISKIHETTGVNPAWLANFNAAVDIFAENATTEQSPVVVVDGYTGLNPDDHTVDGVHLNDGGAILLASRFHAAMFPSGGAVIPDATPTPVPTQLPTATPVPAMTPTQTTGTEGCIVSGRGNQFNIHDIGEGWWLSHDEFPQDAHEGQYPIVATFTENPANTAHNLTWCFITHVTGKHTLELKFLARTNNQDSVYLQIGDGVITSISLGDSPNVRTNNAHRQWAGFADDGMWYEARTAVLIDAIEGQAVEVNFYPQEAQARFFEVWLEPVIAEPEPCGISSYPGVTLEPCPDLVYPEPEG